jgi:hypothetical protein
MFISRVPIHEDRRGESFIGLCNVGLPFENDRSSARRVKTGREIGVAGCAAGDREFPVLDAIYGIDGNTDAVGRRTLRDCADELFRSSFFVKGKGALVPFVRVRADKVQFLAGDGEVTMSFGRPRIFISALPFSLKNFGIGLGRLRGKNHDEHGETGDENNKLSFHRLRL